MCTLCTKATSQTSSVPLWLLYLLDSKISGVPPTPHPLNMGGKKAPYLRITHETAEGQATIAALALTQDWGQGCLMLPAPYTASALLPLTPTALGPHLLPLSHPNPATTQPLGSHSACLPTSPASHSAYSCSCATGFVSHCYWARLGLGLEQAHAPYPRLE